MKKTKLIFISCFLVPSYMFAATYYVSTSGSDSNSGTSPSSPWQTLSHAEENATSPGDIIYLRRGDIWELSSALAITHGGSNGQYITWDGGSWGSGDNATLSTLNHRSYGNESIVNIISCDYLEFKNVIIDGNNKNAFGLAIGGAPAYSDHRQDDEDHIVVRNVKIQNCGDPSASSGGYTSGLVVQTWFNNISNITLSGVTVDGANDDGITLYPGRSDINAIPSEISDVLITDCYITNYGRRGADSGSGLQINNKITNLTVEYTTIIRGLNGNNIAVVIENNEENPNYYPTGIVLRHNIIGSPTRDCLLIQNGLAMTVEIYGNLFIGGTSGVAISGWNGSDYSGASFKIFNNTFYANQQYGFVTSNAQIEGNPTVELKNNIIYTKEGARCVHDGSSAITSHLNNNIYSTSGSSTVIISDGGRTYTMSTLAEWEPTVESRDPLFKDMDNLPTNISSDFGPNTEGLSLLPDSPAIDSGLNLGSMYSTSINQISRPYGNQWDIGAYEMAINSPTVPNSPTGLRLKF